MKKDEIEELEEKIIVKMSLSNMEIARASIENNGNIIRYSEDGISNSDDKGAAVWNLTYEMQSPIVKVADGYVAVGDYNGHIIYLVDSSGSTYEVDTKLPIRDFSVSSASDFALALISC